MQAHRPASLAEMPADDEGVIKKLWDEAATEFETICGESLRGGDIKSFDDVKGVIESRFQAGTSYDAAEQAERDKAKRVGLESLKYMKLLANVTAQASSFIPIPSSAASAANNALAFVFDIPQSIKDYTDAVNQVFDEVSSILAQVKIYETMTIVDPSLCQQIHRVMVSFVKLCAHVVKYQQGRKRSRFFHQLKAGLLHDDTNLKAEMTEFKRVLQQQRDVEGTVTLRAAIETRDGVAMLNQNFGALQNGVEITQQGVQTLLNSGERLKQLKKIKETFGLHNETKTSRAICDKHYEDCHLDTGKWIWAHEAYKQWTTSGKNNEATSHALLLSGPSSSGKTLACARIIKQLEENKEDRTYVAYYFFPNHKNQNSDTDSFSPQLALKHMAFQIASTDPTMQDALYKACQADNTAFWASSGSLSSLWDKLKIGVSGSGKKYYLVFDGLESLSSEHSTDLVNFILSLQVTGEPKAAASQVRVLVSGVQFEDFRAVRASTAFRINMMDANVSDMRILVEHELTKKGMLRHPKPNSDQQNAKAKILEKLPQKVDGSYSNLRFRIDDVIRLLSSRKTNMKDLDRRLDENTSSGQAAIKMRQQSLTEGEVTDLNELLKWVLFCKYSLTLTQLEMAMFFYSDSEALGMTLEYIIKNKYSSILRVEAGGVVNVEDNVSDFLKKAEDSSVKRVRHEDQALISMKITVKNVDPETCGNFLWDLAHQSNRQKFKFGFDAVDANSSNQAAIAVDALKAHHTIVLSTFKYLEQETVDKTKDLGYYLIRWLPYHLASLRSTMHEPNRFFHHQELQEIGQGLHTLFKDNVVFERHKAVFNATLWDVEEMDNIREWLADSSVMGKIVAGDKSWRERMNHNGPAKGYMKEFTESTVRTLLRQRDSEFGTAFEWLQRLMDADGVLLGAPSNPQSDQTKTSSASLTETIRWNRISDWCQDILGLKDPELDSLWYERLASHAASRCDDETIILSLYNRALERENPSWLCHRGLGETHYQNDDLPNAMKHVELALIEAEAEGATPKPRKTDLSELQLILAKYTTRAGHAQVAKDWYLKACHSDDTDQAQEAQVGLLKATFSSPDYQETNKWLQERLNEEDGEERMIGILKKAARDDDHETVILRILVVAFEDPDLWGVVKRVMETASASSALGEDPHHRKDENDMENYRQDMGDESIGVLLYYQGVAKHRFEAPFDTDNSSSEALRLWEASRDKLSGISSYTAYHVCDNAKLEIARHHFQAMRHQDHPIHIETLTRLADEESEKGVYSWRATAFLGSLHAIRGEAALSKAKLVHNVKAGLEILSDDTPNNDMFGLHLIFRALVSHGDFENAAVALLLSQNPDPVAARLSPFKVEDILVYDGVGTQHMLEVVNEVASKTLDLVDSQSLGTSKQTRIEVAAKHVESCLARLESVDGDLDEADRILEIAAHKLITARLRAPQQETADDTGWWGCDGRSMDGKKCKNDAFYHCTYCPDVDFCGGCFERLRSSNKYCNRDITACDSKHQWLKLPPRSSKLYVGPAATVVGVPRVPRRKHDGQVLEVLEGEGKSISLEDWKSDLAQTWGINFGGKGN